MMTQSTLSSISQIDEDGENMEKKMALLKNGNQQIKLRCEAARNELNIVLSELELLENSYSNYGQHEEKQEELKLRCEAARLELKLLKRGLSKLELEDSSSCGCAQDASSAKELEMVANENLNLATAEESGEKKLSKKELAKLERQRKRQEASAASAPPVVTEEADDDPLAANYGQISLKDLQSKGVSGRKWTRIKYLTDELKDKVVLIRGHAQDIRALGKKMNFLVVREERFTVQCVLTVAQDLVSPRMVKFANSLSEESVVDIEGIVSVPSKPFAGVSQKVEIQVRKLHCISKALPKLPINIKDAARSEADIEKALQAGKQLARVNQDTRLNHRVLDLRTPANHAIFRLQDEFEKVGFRGIHTPKLIAGSSEGGAAVFRLDYKGTPACLAQSPQLHKQMAICSGFTRVYEVGAAYRAEDSFTHRHLCEYTSLDLEMTIYEHYSEVMDVVDSFVETFDRLNETCADDLEAINRQYPFKKLKYLRKTLRLTFEEGVRMLKEAGVEVDPFGDLSTETERQLGQLVLEKYGTEFFILHRFPLAVRPFYTMPCYDNPNYSNSFDVFLRGEEIISGAQRIHDPELLIERARAHKIDVSAPAISAYIDALRYGTQLHGGFAVGLERVGMLFCGLDNIRKTSLFPRDPRRIAP